MPLTVNGENTELRFERRGLRPATVVLVAVGTLVVLLAIAFCGGLYLSDQRIKAELAKIRAAGDPVTVIDLDKSYSLPSDSRDAIALWLEAVEMIGLPGYKNDAANFPWVSDSTITMPRPGAPWAQQAAAEHFLSKYADLLTKLHEAAAMGGAARYPLSFSNGVPIIAKPLPELTLLTPLLKFEAEVFARRGEGHAAAESICAIFALAQSLERHPFLAAQLLRLANDRAAADHFARLLAMVDLRRDDLAMIDEALARIDYCESFHRCMLAERVMTMQEFGHPGVGDGQSPTLGNWSFLRQGDFAIYLQSMGELVAASELVAAHDEKNVSSLLVAMDQARERVRTVAAASGSSWRYPITKAFNPSLQPFAESVCCGTARRDMARTAVAVERFRRSRGCLPKTLDDLVPDFVSTAPTDPFSGGPLQWSVTGDDYRIYSVGPNGNDDGGTTAQSDFAGDVVLRVRRRTAGEAATTAE